MSFTDAETHLTFTLRNVAAQGTENSLSSPIIKDSAVIQTVRRETMMAAKLKGLFPPASKSTATDFSTMATAPNTTFKHVGEGLRGYIQHKHRGPRFLIMGTLK